jgi:[acyl-carrier-protein] S-malonyltransferase
MNDAFSLIKLRSEAMNEAARNSDGGMAAVLGLPAETVEEICKTVSESGKYVIAANYNSPVQTVISGTKDALADAEALCKEKKAKRFVRLNVTAAFHSELMKEAAEKFKAGIGDFKFAQPAAGLKVFSNIDGQEMTNFEDMQTYLTKHICSPVRFTKELASMKEAGFTKYVECGGKVLTGLVKKTLDGVEAVSLSDAKDYEIIKAGI